MIVVKFTLERRSERCKDVRFLGLVLNLLEYMLLNEAYSIPKYIHREIKTKLVRGISSLMIATLF